MNLPLNGSGSEEEALNQLSQAAKLVKKAMRLLEPTDENSDEILNEFVKLAYYGLRAVHMHVDSAKNIMISMALDDIPQLR